ncbi:MAG: ABC transporter substrate-binding protein [Promethearchaeota archaeon]|jgi:peptide/nickel transport system substrate-binding protein
MKMEKKNVVLIILVIVLISAGIGNIIFVAELELAPPVPIRTIKFGSMYIAEEIDPQYAWDNASSNAIIMTWEGLLASNLSHPEMDLYPLLANDLGTYDVTGTELTFDLKSGVKFHDGTDFNADAVVWSFQRLHYLMNTTWNGAPHPWGPLPGTVFYSIPTLVTPLYYIEGNPIIQNIETITPTQVKFTLSQPYGPFRSLLAFSASVIMSPASTPQLDYINPATVDNGTCIGTGPMKIEKLVSYELRFAAFEEYHRSRIGFDVLVHVKIQDYDARNMAILSGAVDIIADPGVYYFPTMEAEEEVFLYKAGCKAIPVYMGLNNKQINITWRHAISYALNYSSIIDHLENAFNYTATRLKSPLPKGVLYANWSFNYPIFNVTKARKIMQSMGFGVGWDATFPGNHEAQWISANFRTLNYTYNAGSSITTGEIIGDAINDSLDYIGIDYEDAPFALDDFIDRLYNRRVQSAGWDALQLYYWRLWPDFNDPSKYLNPLFSNISASNAAQVNDPYLQGLLDQGIEETGPTREAIYDEIQQYLVEELRPYAWLYVEKNYDIWDKDLRGFASNAMDLAYFYPCYWD